MLTYAAAVDAEARERQNAEEKSETAAAEAIARQQAAAGSQFTCFAN
jgi:hypothetical protein